MDKPSESRFDDAWRDALRHGHLAAPWPAVGKGEQATAASAAGPESADCEIADWADVLRRAEQASPLAQVSGAKTAATAANDAPPIRFARWGTGRRLLGAACMAGALAGLVWWQAPHTETETQGDAVAPSGVVSAPGTPRSAAPSALPINDLPLVQVDAPSAQAARWVAELERLGATVLVSSDASGDVTLDIAVTDEPRRAPVTLWLSSFDQQLDGQGRLKLRLAARR